MERFLIKCADVVIDISCRYPENKRRCSDYIVEGLEADITIEPQESDYEIVSEKFPERSKQDVEFTTISNMISQHMLNYNAILLHAAGICLDGRGIVFSALSGTGKTTHIHLWKKLFGDKVIIVNGDKPLLTVRDNHVFMSGTPWCGKESYSKNTTVPLNTFVFLERAEKNNIQKMDKTEVLRRIFYQISIPTVGSEYMGKALKITDALVKNLDFYLLKCNMDDDAAITAYNGIFNRGELS